MVIGIRLTCSPLSPRHHLLQFSAFSALPRACGDRIQADSIRVFLMVKVRRNE
jgi:hypothetical protein